MQNSEIIEKRSNILISEDFNKKSLSIMFLLFIISTLLLVSSLNVVTTLIELISLVLVLTSLFIYVKNRLDLKRIDRSIYRNYQPVINKKVEVLEIDDIEVLYMDDEK